MLDVRMLSMWWPMLLGSCCPAATPESGSTFTWCFPVVDDMLTVTWGAGLVIMSCIMYKRRCDWLPLDSTCSALKPGLGCIPLIAVCGCYDVCWLVCGVVLIGMDWLTVAHLRKVPDFVAGHTYLIVRWAWHQPPWCAGWPHPWHVGPEGCCCLGLYIAARPAILLGSAVWMSWRFFFAASRVWHMVTFLARVRSLSCSKSSIVSPSFDPSMIWSLIFFSLHTSEQNLQVFDSSWSDMGKLSKASPDCWTFLRKLRLSTVSFMCLSTYRWRAWVTWAA